MGGAALGADVTDGAARPSCPARSASSAARSTRSTSAHLAVAQEAREALGLERIVFVPAGEPPHKPGRAITPGAPAPGHARAGDRRQRPVRDRPRRARPGRAFVHGRHARGPARIGRQAPDLVLILSAEAFLGLMTWRDPDRILELARVAVAPRDGYPDAGRDFLEANLPGLADRVDLPPWAPAAPSRRARCARGRRPADPCAISSRTRSRPTSATIGCTEIT